MYEYEILVYVNSKKGFLRIASVPTGKTSKEKPPEAKTAEQVAGKELTFWSQNQKTKDWNEHGLRTYLYDPVANKWTDLNAANPPPYRGSKYGLAYDPKNDVVLLVGGAIGWNGPHCKDMWLYDVKANAWTKLDPKLDGAKPNEVFTCSGENLMASYDTRHEVFIFRAGALWAYRYKK